MTIRHFVLFRLNSQDPVQRARDAEFCCAELAPLVDRIDEALDLNVHCNTLKRGENWDFALIADFADEAALAAYAVHPAHQAAIARTNHLVAERAAIDSYI